jgi:tRNA pseudouridine55 synthase
LVNKKDEDSATFMVTSGKGTYIRALARDLAAKLGTCGHISSLRRLKVGSFSENDAISLDYLETLAHSPANFNKLLPVEVALDGIPAMPLSGDQADRMRNGQSVPLEKEADWCCSLALEEGRIIYTMSSGLPVAIARLQQGFVCPIRVLNF